MRFFEKLKNLVKLIRTVDDRLIKVQQSLGRIEERQLNAKPDKVFQDYEFQVYSQWRMV